MKEDNFVSLNGHKIDETHTRGVLGPGTGLGNSIIYTAPFRKRERVYVLPSEGGHTDVGYVDSEVVEYVDFFKEKINLKYISLERSFCGPSLPYAFQFFAKKNPELDDSHLIPTSEEIIQKYLKNPYENSLYTKTI